uniref:Secreted protein n=1 Tax=Panagrellus redivivus TaxID=6233 RepID=A0A7E4V9K6_PANRE
MFAFALFSAHRKPSKARSTVVLTEAVTMPAELSRAFEVTADHQLSQTWDTSLPAIIEHLSDIYCFFYDFQTSLT